MSRSVRSSAEICDFNFFNDFGHKFWVYISLQMETKGDYCRLHVRVKAKVKIGQTVAISGSSASLGVFNKERVVKLVTTPDSYPIWYTLEPIILPREETVFYKY